VPPLTVQAIALRQERRGDNFISYQALARDHPVQYLMRRVSSRKLATSAIDLFDEGEFTIDVKEDERRGFIRDFHLVKKHHAIAANYAALQAASRFARLLLANPVHDDNRPFLYELACKGLDSWAASHPPDAVYLKCLYLYCREEGCPVAQEWFPSLPPRLAQIAKQTLNQPLATPTSPAADLHPCIESLESYVRHHTHISLPA